MIGTTILGYDVDAKLGEGGMGAVYRAVNPLLGQVVAIKLLDPTLARNADIRERFVQEARIQITLQHPGIVRVLTADVSGERPALVMEYVDGLSLAEVLGRRGALPTAEALRLFEQICAAVGYAHAHGVVHRDLKPANVMVQGNGVVKVMDFGIARVMGSSALTRTGTSMGSPQYMSPEQVLGRKDLDHRTDIYSLGCIAYELFAGHRPFASVEDDATSDSDYRIKDAHVREEPADPRTLKPDLSPAVAEAIMTALAKDPGRRFQNATDFAASLRSGEAAPQRLNEAPPSTPLAPSPVASSVVSRPEPLLTPAPPPPPLAAGAAPPRPRLTAVAIVCGVVVLILIAGALLTRKPPPAAVAETLPQAPSTEAQRAPPSPAPHSAPPDGPQAPTWVPVRGGSFIMGCALSDTKCFAKEEPRRAVSVAGFSLMKAELTVDEYDQCVLAGRCAPTATGPQCNFGVAGRGRHPINCISYRAAEDVCRFFGGRLPSAEEWEYAARSGGETTFPWGDQRPDGDRANFCDMKCPAVLTADHDTAMARANKVDLVAARQMRVSDEIDDGYAGTAPVDAYPAGANRWGFLGMAGNVNEWTSTPFGGGMEQRGGSCIDRPTALRSSNRFPQKPSAEVFQSGVRCAQ